MTHNRSTCGLLGRGESPRGATARLAVVDDSSIRRCHETRSRRTFAPGISSLTCYLKDPPTPTELALSPLGSLGNLSLEYAATPPRLTYLLARCACRERTRSGQLFTSRAL